MSPEIEELFEDNIRLDNFLKNEITNRKLPERLFVSDFLPYFCGELDLSSNPKLLDMWYTISGGQTNEVDVVDIDGSVLFVVPALLNTKVINPRTNRGDLSFADIITLSKLKSNITPIAGENALTQGLEIKVEQMREHKSTSFSENENKWNFIFQKYGKVDKEKEISNKTVKGKISDDELEF